MTMELKHFKDHFCYDYLRYHPLEPIKLSKEKDERTRSEHEQTIALLEIYSATII